jgi:hypothetical protein
MYWDKLEDEQYEEKQSEVVKFEEKGDEFIGVFRGIVEYSNANGEGKFYKFEDVDDEEKEFIIFPTTVLETKFKRVPLDAMVKIVYLGKKKSEKNPKYSYKDYDIYIGS